MLKTSDFFDELKLRRDSHVADFGCGVGENSKILSELVVDGKVFAVDVHKDLLEILESEIAKEKKKGSGLYTNIVPVWGDIEEVDGTRLRDDTIDAILISNTFYLFKHKKTALLEIRRVLKKYGKVLFIDWHTGLGDSQLHREVTLKEKEVEQMFTDAGFIFHPRVHKDQHHFVLVMEKR